MTRAVSSTFSPLWELEATAVSSCSLRGDEKLPLPLVSELRRGVRGFMVMRGKACLG